MCIVKGEWPGRGDSNEGLGRIRGLECALCVQGLGACLSEG